VDASRIQLSELYGPSALLRFLYERLGKWLSVPGACALWAVLQTGAFVALAWSQGTLFIERSSVEEPPRTLNLLEDTTALAYCVLLPLCFLLLYYSLRLFRRHLNLLDRTLAPSAPPGAHEELIAVARESFTPGRIRPVRLWCFAVGLLIAAFNLVTNLYPGFFYEAPDKWDGIAHPLTFAVSRLYVLFAWGYAIPTWAAVVCTQFVAMARINQVMADRGWVRVSPYAADQFGGLKGLATSASWVGYLVVLAGLFFLAPSLRWLLRERALHAGNFVGMGLYVLFAAAGVLAPVYLLHRVLSRKRTEMLEFLNGAFDRINERVSGLVKANDFETLGEENLGRGLETVDRLYVQWSALPNWPVTWAIMLKFAATVVVPAAGYFAVQQFLKQLPL
jgi:hypothetical protein